MDEIHRNIDAYYTGKIKQFGATPQGVDWNGEESQTNRFRQLSKIITAQQSFSVVDIGCGYGKYVDFLTDEGYEAFRYTGYDLSDEMITNARRLHCESADTRFWTIQELSEIETADYAVASGIFSVKMEHTESEWLSYVLNTLDAMHEKSEKGFSFNMLTKYSDKEYMRPDLYYADPLFIFDYCKRNFSKQVALLHDYGLYEFTILVRKGG